MSDLIEASKKTRFFTVVNTENEAAQARLMIDSLRAFGGEMRECPVWVFLPQAGFTADFSALGEVVLFPLEIEAHYSDYLFADKVFACSRAEELTGADTRSLVWLNLDCLIVNPPVLFDLGAAFDAAFRPVHIRNVGSPTGEALDDYWKTVYQTVGLSEASYSVESFVDAQILRPYFNTHCFSINPSRGILQTWREYFKMLVADSEFQAGPCRDELHQIFLHQVVLSTLIVKSLDQGRIRILPPSYSYPLHLLDRLPPERRIPSLNQTVCPVYEDANPLEDIEIQDPLKSWLLAHHWH